MKKVPPAQAARKAAGRSPARDVGRLYGQAVDERGNLYADLGIRPIVSTDPLRGVKGTWEVRYGKRHVAQRLLSVVALLALQLTATPPSPANASCSPAPTGGNDVITCDAANDAIDALAGNDTVSGGAGDDTLIGNSGSDTLDGGPGNDALNGGSGTDRVLQTVDANQTLTNTQLTGQGTDTLSSIERATLTGGASDNTLDASAFTAGRVILNGLAGNDVLSGGSRADTLDGGDGDDRLTGGSGNDALTGGAGTDTVVQTVNANQVLTDVLLTGTGNDSLSSIESAALTGGAGNNTINASAFTAGPVTLSGLGGNDTLSGGAGNDTLNGEAGNDTLTGGAGNDTLVAGLGNDTYAFNTNSALGTDTLAEASGEGTDRLNFSSSTAAVTVDLASTSLQAVNSNLILRLTASEVENVTGGNGDDTIAGNGLDNSLSGGAGNDVLSGGDGTDTLDGGTGNDTLNGGAGNDVLSGGDGNDALNGGDGDDALSTDNGIDDLDAGAGNDTLRLAGVHVAGDRAAGGSGTNLFQFLAGTSGPLQAVSAGDDTLDFTLFGSPITIDLGNSSQQNVGGGLLLTLTGVFRNVIGTLFNDVILGNAADNTFSGLAGNDTLAGAAGSDQLNGGDGDDSLDGGADADALDGGTGTDTVANYESQDSHSSIEIGLPTPTPTPSPPSGPSQSTATPPLEVVIVYTADGVEVPLSCGARSTRLVLESGDYAEFTGFCGYRVALTQLAESALPADLPAEMALISAVDVRLLDRPSRLGLLPVGGSLTFSYAPRTTDPQNLRILYWDATRKEGSGDWVELPPLGPDPVPLYPDLLEDGRWILEGVDPTAAGAVEATVNFIGLFVLVAAGSPS